MPIPKSKSKPTLITPLLQDTAATGGNVHIAKERGECTLNCSSSNTLFDDNAKHLRLAKLEKLLEPLHYCFQQR